MQGASLSHGFDSSAKLLNERNDWRLRTFLSLVNASNQLDAPKMRAAHDARQENPPFRTATSHACTPTGRVQEIDFINKSITSRFYSVYTRHLQLRKFTKYCSPRLCTWRALMLHNNHNNAHKNDRHACHR
jgi:hypothetical protein